MAKKKKQASSEGFRQLTPEEAKKEEENRKRALGIILDPPPPDDNNSEEQDKNKQQQQQPQKKNDKTYVDSALPAPNASLLAVEPLHNFATAMSSLGALHVQIVDLTSQLEKRRTNYEDFLKEKEQFTKEKEKVNNEMKKKDEEIKKLKNELAFHKLMLRSRPRIDEGNPLAKNELLSRILYYADLDRYDMSKLSCVNKHFLKACQELLFKKALQPVKLYTALSCDNLVEILGKREHLMKMVEEIIFNFVPDSLHAPLECIPRSILDLLPITKQVKSLTFLQMGARAATLTILFPVAKQLESLKIDPGEYRLTGLPVYASHERMRGIIAGFPKLQHLHLERVELHIAAPYRHSAGYDPDFQCPLRTLTLKTVTVQGPLPTMLTQSLRSSVLTKLHLEACTLHSVFDIFQIIQRSGLSLKELTIRTNRYAYARQPHHGPLTLDAALSTCINLEILNLEVLNLPFDTPAKFLEGCKNIKQLELEVDRDVQADDWLELFACPSQNIEKLTIVNCPWSSFQVTVLKERWKSRPGSIGKLEFVTRGARRGPPGTTNGPGGPGVGPGMGNVISPGVGHGIGPGVGGIPNGSTPMFAHPGF